MSETNGDKGIAEKLAEMAEEQRAAWARLETVEEKHQYIDEKMAELVHWQMRSAAETDRRFEAYRQQAEENRTEDEAHRREMEKHLRHLTQVVRFLGDKTIEFDGKLRRAGEVFAEGEAINS